MNLNKFTPDDQKKIQLEQNFQKKDDPADLAMLQQEVEDQMSMLIVNPTKLEMITVGATYWGGTVG
jgi:hypothetical protein